MGGSDGDLLAHDGGHHRRAGIDAQGPLGVDYAPSDGCEVLIPAGEDPSGLGDGVLQLVGVHLHVAERGHVIGGAAGAADRPRGHLRDDEALGSDDGYDDGGDAIARNPSQAVEVEHRRRPQVRGPPRGCHGPGKIGDLRQIGVHGGESGDEGQYLLLGDRALGDVVDYRHHLGRGEPGALDLPPYGPDGLRRRGVDDGDPIPVGDGQPLHQTAPETDESLGSGGIGYDDGGDRGPDSGHHHPIGDRYAHLQAVVRIQDDSGFGMGQSRGADRQHHRDAPPSIAGMSNVPNSELVPVRMDPVLIRCLPCRHVVSRQGWKPRLRLIYVSILCT